MNSGQFPTLLSNTAWILKPKGDQNDVIFGLKIGVGKGTCDETQLLLVFSSLRSLVT